MRFGRSKYISKEQPASDYSTHVHPNLVTLRHLIFHFYPLVLAVHHAGGAQTGKPHAGIQGQQILLA
jgi:hypothetical protein